MLAWSLAALAAAVLASADRDRVVRGAGGLVLLALAGGSLYVGAGSLEPERLSRVAMTAALPPWFLETNLAFLCLGVLLAVVGTRSWLAGAGGAAVLAGLWPVAGGVSLLRTAAILLAVGAGTVVVSLALQAASARIWPAKPVAVSPPARPSSLSGRMIVGAGLLALASPWAAGTLAAATAAYLVAVGRSADRLQRLALGSSALLALAALVVWILAGSPPSPEGPAGPYLSGRHSLLVAGCLLIPSAVGMAAWPLNRLAPGWTLLPAAFALVGRVGPEAIPLGLAWWLPVVFPVAIAGVVRGLLAQEWGRSAGSLAWAGLWLGSPESRAGALLLGIAVMAGSASLQGQSRWAGLMTRILWAAGGVGASLVLWGGLTAQVVYSALLALFAAAALASARVAAPGPSA